MDSDTNQSNSLNFKNKFLVYSISGGFFTQLMIASMIPPLLPAFAFDLKLTQASMAFLLAIRASSSFISTFLFAILRKYFGHSFTIFLSFLLLSASSFLFAFSTNWNLLALAMLIQGLGHQGVWSTGLSSASLLFNFDESEQNHDASTQVQATAHAPPLIQGGLTAVPGWVKNWKTLITKKGSNGANEENESRGRTIVNLIAVVGIMFAGASSGSVVGPLMGGLLFDFVQKNVPFFVTSGLSIFFAFLLFFIIPGRRRNTIKVLSPERRKRNARQNNAITPLEVIIEDSGELETGEDLETEEETKGKQAALEIQKEGNSKKPSASKVEKDEQSRKSIVLSLFWLVLTNPISASVLILAVVEAMAWGTLEATLPFHLSSHCGYETHNVAISFTACHLAYVLTSTGVDTIVDVVGTMPSIILGLLFILISWPILALKGIACQLPVQCLIMGFSGVGFALASAPCFPLMVDVLDEHGFPEYKLAIKVFNSTYTLGLVVGPLFATLLLMKLPTIGVLGSMSAIMALCLPLACLYRRK